MQLHKVHNHSLTRSGLALFIKSLEAYLCETIFRMSCSNNEVSTTVLMKAHNAALPYTSPPTNPAVKLQGVPINVGASPQPCLHCPLQRMHVLEHPR